MNVKQARALFPALENLTYFNTASLAMGCAPARRAYEKAVAEWSEGKFDWRLAEQAGDDSRDLFAAIINANPEEIAIVPAVSTAAGVVAAQLGPAKHHENVLVADIEFSSNLFPWLSLRNLGYDVRIVNSIDGTLPTDSYAALADGGTRLIAVSAVQSSNGFRADLAGLREIADRSGAWVFVDACQAAGAVSLDAQRDGFDFLSTSSHKFLLGSRGMGYLYIRRELIDKVRPVLPGWRASRNPLKDFYGPEMNLSKTASKLDTSVIWFAALGERESLGIFQRIGLDAILKYNEILTEHIHRRLSERSTAYRPFPAANRSTIVSVPVADPDRTMTLLRDSNVVASMRAGRIRLSLHFYNTEDEIDRVVDLIAGV